MKKIASSAVLLTGILAVVLTGAAADPSTTIGLIDFFGYKGLDVAKVRAALPVHEDDPITPQTSEQISAAVLAAIGKKPTEVHRVCCDPKGRTLIYIGLPGETYKPLAFNPVPAGNDQLPAEIVKLEQEMEDANGAAVRKGGDAATEDDSQGYALTKDPAARAVQMKMHDWAVEHEAELENVLRSSSNAQQRRVASEMLGYAKQSPQQIAALMYAMRDADSGVRNNATRALLVLVHSNPALAAQIDPDTPLAMLSSGSWTDLNKGAGLLESMTTSRDPKLLARIRAEALDPLIEMATWSDLNHALIARFILGRVGGIPDQKLMTMLMENQVDPIIAAARGK